VVTRGGWRSGVRGWGCIAAIALLLTARPSSAAVSREAAAAIARYRSALNALERRTPGASVEGVYHQALALTRPLISPKHKENSIVHLTEAELATLEMQLRGLDINTDEVLFVRPDARFFRELSLKYGHVADVAFFTEMLATYPVAVFIPTYVEHLSEVFDCTAFQSGELVARYGAWLAYSRKFPTVYMAQVADELHRIETESRSMCSCGTLASYLRELHDFNTRFPTNPVRDDIAKLIDAAEHGRSKVRMNCER
jgi:hypothetical protein